MAAAQSPKITGNVAFPGALERRIAVTDNPALQSDAGAAPADCGALSRQTSNAARHTPLRTTSHPPHERGTHSAAIAALRLASIWSIAAVTASNVSRVEAWRAL